MLNGLNSLVDESLARLEEGAAEPRFRMLETIREYAAEKLAASGEADAVRRKHATYFLGFAERAAAEIGGPDRSRWLDRLQQEEPNLRLALGWFEGTGDAGEEARLGLALSQLWWLRGFPLMTSQDMQRVLRASSPREAALALRGLPGPVRDEFTSNVSARAARALAEEIEGLRSAPASDVVAAQQRLTATVRRLHESGDILLDWASWFAEVAHLATGDARRVLRDVPRERLVLALSGADEAVRGSVLRGLSSGARRALREQIERAGTPSPLAVEDAQREIAGALHRLHQAGEIAIRSTDAERMREAQSTAELARFRRVREAGEVDGSGC